MITIALFDNDDNMLNFIEKIIKKWFFNKCTVVSCNDSDSLVAALDKHHFNFFFMGINSFGESWIEAVEKARKNNSNSRIVFMGNEKNIPSEAFRYCPVGYISKSNIKEDMWRTLDIMTEYMEECKELPAKSGFNYIHIYDIIYSEIFDHTITIHTSHTDYTVPMTMDELEKQIGEYGMIRVHKSFLVNYRCIASVMAKDVVLTNGKAVPLSKSRSKEVRDKLRTFLNIN